MGIPSERFYPAEALPGNVGEHAGACNNHDLQPGISEVPIAGTLLEWRWSERVSAARRTPVLPATTTEQPFFDALYAPTLLNDDDDLHFVEVDGFLIDVQRGAATVGKPAAALALEKS